MLNKKKELFAATFFKNCAWHGHKYSRMGMVKARHLCKKWFGPSIPERSASRYMSQLKQEKVFDRQRRAPRAKDGRITAQTSLTYLKEGAFRMMGNFKPLVNAFYRLADAPKMAYNLFKNRGDHLRPVDKWAKDDNLLLKGSPAGSFSCGLSPPPDPAK